MPTADQSAASLAERQVPTASVTCARLKLSIQGAVQGVGFRPFIYRLATALGLRGWVNNTAHGVLVEVEGPRDVLQDFLLRVERDKPAISFIHSLESSFADPAGYEGFEIRKSEEGEKTALVMPDISTCPECLQDLFDRDNRRFGYPFTNCTNCGPRYSIIESLPYDRPRTTMKKFCMCAECAREYHDPLDRRFHAQPNACQECGPQLELWSMAGAVLAHRGEALERTAEALGDGRIVGVKGLGGFHLMVDARNEDAVRELRRRKHREEKPFALMFPSEERLLQECEAGPLELRLLRSPESPIVLLCRRGFPPVTGTTPEMSSRVADSVAPGNPLFGAMLPYTPLHHLLLRKLGFAVVATSGNLSDEPICIDEREALERLRGVADLLLVHDRPILRHMDDSIVRLMAGREMVLRRARGFAPLPVLLDEELPSMLAVGAHQKNTVALSVGRQVFLSQHIGDLETAAASAAFEHAAESLQGLYESTPKWLACDLHPDYASSVYAQRISPSPMRVQHHYAHVLACMAENSVKSPALGVAWDGSGWGTDGTVWGGEFLKIDECGYTRVARLRRLRLAGSERAVREPRRCGLGLLYETLGEAALAREELAPMTAFPARERKILGSMLRHGLNSPWTSSAGRLFDGVASLIGLRQLTRHEGQAAMELEWLAARSTESSTYDFVLKPASDGPAELDWSPMVDAVILELAEHQRPEAIARKFHNTLAEMIARVVAEFAGGSPAMPVVLSGGCFQNRLLTELTIARLSADGVRVYWHQRVPPNDGGIALGQVMAAARMSKLAKVECAAPEQQGSSA